MSKVFMDTNILVYSMDGSNLLKQQTCRRLLREAATQNTGVISTQVMQEFYVAATSKLRADPLIVKDILRSFERFEIVVVLPSLIKEAIDCSMPIRLTQNCRSLQGSCAF